MVVAVPVVPHGGAAGDLLHHPEGDVLFPLVHRGRRHHEIEAAQRLAQIAPRALGEVGTGVLVHRHGLRLGRRELFQSVADAPLHIGGRERLELEHGAAGQQRIIDVKVGVLRRGGDEGDGAVLDALQEALLLLFVEVLYLVEVEQDAPCPGQCADVLQHGLDVAGAAGGAVELMESHPAVLGDDTGHSGLARAGRAVEDHVGDAAALDGAAEHLPLGQKMLLAADIGQRFGAQTLRQRFVHGSSLQA